MKTLTSTIACGAFAFALGLGTLEATALPVVAPAISDVATPAAPAARTDKVYYRRYYRGYGYRRYGYRGYYRPYYGYRYGYYRRPYVGIGVPFVHFGIY